MSESYLIPSQAHSQELVIKKSRFICWLAHTPSIESAKQFIEQIKQQYPDARHHCWAFVAAAPSTTQALGFSDDGEPSGTAGQPMLTVLRHSGVGEICAVVVRYFGGIKLGTGGLVRAYGQSVQQALQTLPTQVVVPCCTVEILTDYAQAATIEQWQHRFEMCLLQQDYQQQVSLQYSLPVAEREAFEAKLCLLSGTQWQWLTE